MLWALYCILYWWPLSVTLVFHPMKQSYPQIVVISFFFQLPNYSVTNLMWSISHYTSWYWVIQVFCLFEPSCVFYETSPICFQCIQVTDNKYSVIYQHIKIINPRISTPIITQCVWLGNSTEKCWAMSVID